jgi:hypothetical protein
MRAESRPLGKREIAIAGRRVQGIVPAPEPTTPSGRVIDEAIRARGPASRRSFRSTSADMGTSTCRPTTPSWRAAFRRSSSRKRRWPTEIEFEEAALADGLTSLPGIPVPG